MTKKKVPGEEEKVETTKKESGKKENQKTKKAKTTKEKETKDVKNENSYMDYVRAVDDAEDVERVKNDPYYSSSREDFSYSNLFKMKGDTLMNRHKREYEVHRILHEIKSFICRCNDSGFSSAEVFLVSDPEDPRVVKAYTEAIHALKIPFETSVSVDFIVDAIRRYINSSICDYEYTIGCFNSPSAGYAHLAFTWGRKSEEKAMEEKEIEKMEEKEIEKKENNEKEVSKDPITLEYLQDTSFYAKHAIPLPCHDLIDQFAEIIDKYMVSCATNGYDGINIFATTEKYNRDDNLVKLIIPDKYKKNFDDIMAFIYYRYASKRFRVIFEKTEYNGYGDFFYNIHIDWITPGDQSPYNPVFIDDDEEVE